MYERKEKVTAVYYEGKYSLVSVIVFCLNVVLQNLLCCSVSSGCGKAL